MINKIRFTKKGQAAVELAVFGSLILVAFSILLNYGQRLEMQQQIKMEAFRKALQKSYERNASVTYTMKKDVRSFGLFSGLGQGQSGTQGSTANVMWQKGMSGDQNDPNPNKQKSYSYYVINDSNIGGDEGLPTYTKEVRNYMGEDKDVEVPVSVWSEEQRRIEQFDSSTTKAENSSGITNTKTSNLQDTTTTVLHTRRDTAFDDDPWDKAAPLPEYVYDGVPYTLTHGAYYNQDTNRVEYDTSHAGATIRRERTWQTAY